LVQVERKEGEQVVTNTYICDVCKKSVGKEDLCNVTVSLKLGDGVWRSSSDNKKDICRDCLRKRDLLIETEKDGRTETAIKDKTFESKFVDLLQDLGVLFEE
jgi:hypothetical protein